MKNYKNILICIMATAGVSCDSADKGTMRGTHEIAKSQSYCNPLDVTMADPFVLLHKGTYYLYGTYSSDDGLLVFTSKDLVNWEMQDYVFEKTPYTWSQNHFWGPEVIYTGNEFYMYLNASPNKDSKAKPTNMRLCIAKSDSPLGPFREVKAPFYTPKPGDEAIDQNIFIDDDGKAYLYITQVTIGRNEVFGVKLKDSMTEFDGEPVLCITPEQPWESHPWPNHKVAEGAYVLKHKGYYYLLYTANHYLDPNYCMGYAVSKGPLGPWEKYKGNPILKRTEHIHGPGNGMIVPSPDGKELFLVYHVHNRIGKVSPRKLAIDRIYFVPQDDGPDMIKVEGPTHTPQPYPSS